jgi:hypothetical protein
MPKAAPVFSPWVIWKKPVCGHEPPSAMALDTHHFVSLSSTTTAVAVKGK